MSPGLSLLVNTAFDTLNWMDDNKITIQQNLLEGNIADSNINPDGNSIGSIGKEWDTLDEPISTTLMRDVNGIAVKLKHILVPISSCDTYKNVLKNWDLWGPLILCTFISLTLHHNEEQSNGMIYVGPHFAEIFVLIWLGTYLVSLNFKLLICSPRRRNHIDKGNPLSSPSLFQLLCVFGYCLAPACIGITLLNIVASILSLQFKHLIYEKLFIGILFGFVWPTFASVKILGRYQEKEKKALAIYPIALFYFVLSLVIITSH